MSVTKEMFNDFSKIVDSIEFDRDPTKFIQFLAKDDFFIAPASTKYHNNIPGGLYRHCKGVYEVLVKLNSMLPNEKQYSNETLFFVAFGHDVCKIGIYEPAKVWYKDENNAWKSNPGYKKKDDKYPIGHGEKSLLIMSKLLDLTLDEELAIRWHMSAYEIGTMLDPNTGRSYSDSQNLSPLVRLTQSADAFSLELEVHI